MFLVLHHSATQFHRSQGGWSSRFMMHGMPGRPPEKPLGYLHVGGLMTSEFLSARTWRVDMVQLLEAPSGKVS